MDRPSRLFQAVVGAGIGLGATLAGCGAGPATSETPANQAYGSSVTDPSASETLGADAAALDGNQYATVGELFEAFCDAPWPTTKGGVQAPGQVTPPACVDPHQQCIGQTPVMCEGATDGGLCSDPQFADCVGGQYMCPVGQMPACDCPHPFVSDYWSCTGASGG
ncbi:MAG: hypothetical protein ABTD50_09475 [Polyangiaceae bacterium]|jgi:hypothetical protein